MSKASKIIFPLFAVAALVAAVLWQLFLAQTVSYYLIAVVVLIAALLPFFISYEKSAPSARELSLMAVLIALAVVSRAVFFFVPNFKPIAAVVIAGAVCLGAERGYILGALSAFISNFLFGQGVWTPFQMVALGTVGFVAGVLFQHVSARRWQLSAFGFIIVFFFYGLLVDLSSILTMAADYTLGSILAIYAAGVPYTAVFAASTAIFLFLFGEEFIKKIDRIVSKYGILEGASNEQ